MPKKESRREISRQVSEVAKAAESLNKSVTDGKSAPYKGGQRTRKAFERNAKKRAVVQDYEGVIPLSKEIQKELDADIRQYAQNLEAEFEYLVETIGEERAIVEIRSRIDIATNARKIAKEGIEKKMQAITTRANLEVIKTAVGGARFKKMKENEVERSNLVSYVGEKGWQDVKSMSEGMFDLISGQSQKSKSRLAQKFASGLEGDEPVDLKALVKDELGIAGRRATLIARDQTAKFNSIVTERRMNDFGVSVYQWIATTGDGRTRDLHKKRHLKYFLIGTPAEANYDGPPGKPPNCRCSMKPVFDEAQVLKLIDAIMKNSSASYLGV